jgi:large repetitive protein
MPMTRHGLAGVSGAVCLLLTALDLPAATVSGRVLDPAGAPVAGAKVVWEAYRSDEETLVDETRGTQPAPLGETATDGQGRFQVKLEKPGVEVSIRVLPGGLPGAILRGPYDSSEDVTLDDVELPAAERVSGRVVDDGGKPVSGARLRVVGGLPFEEDDVTAYADGTSAADGSFSIANAPANAMELTTRAAGYAPTVTVRMQRRSVDKVTLRSGGTVQGIVADPSGKPAAGAIVTAGATAAATDAAGAFRLAGVAPGDPAVEAIWKGDFVARKSPVRVKKGETVDVSLQLARAASIAGTVIDEKSRRPISGVRLAATSPRFALRRAGPARAARTDAKGRFRIPGLAPGAYSVAASKTDYVPATMSGVVAELSSRAVVSIALAKAAAVAGRVTDEAGAPVPGARVRIATDLGMRAILREGPAAFLESGGVTTGPDGVFRLRGLAAAKNKTIEASKTGFVPARRHGVTLRAGETVKEVALVLKKGLEARGRVVDAAGKPVAGAELRLARPEGGARRMMFQMAGGDREKPDAVSGADGSFRLGGLEPGEYSLSATREGYASKRIPAVTVETEGPNEWPPVVLVPASAIAGVVRNSRGEPVVGAQVFTFGEGASRDATTDAEGRFRLEGYGSERAVMLSVNADGYGALQRRVTPPAEDLALVLKTSGAIRGRVEDAATNRPVTEFTASYTEARGGGFGGMRILTGGRDNQRAFQSADGAFELSDVPAGRWTVSATAPGYRPAEVSGVEVGEGETKDGVVLSLKRGAAVSGRVLDPRRGTGVPNASVSWSDGSGAGGMGAGAIARLTGENNAVTTDADGRFRFERLPDGRLTLTAEHPDYLEVSRTIEVADEASADLTLSLGGSITGTVVGRDGRSPVAGAQVALEGMGDTFGWGEDSSRADGSGNFSFEHLKAGRYRVSARSAAGSSPSKEVVLAENQSLTGVLIEMASGALVRGTVTGLPAGRAAGVRVFASSRDYEESAITGDQGTFVLRDVPAGILRLQASVSFPAMRSTSKTVEIAEGSSEVAVEIAFEGTSRLSGRITRGDRPVSNAFVSVAPDPPTATGGRGSDQADEDGRYSIEGLSDGGYRIQVSGQGVRHSRTLEVSGDTNGDIDVPAITLSGVVAESGSSEPLEGASVQAESGTETGPYDIKRTVTDSRGFYSIENLDPGNYQLTARKEGYQLKTQPVTISESSVELNLSLARGAGLAVRAVDGLTGLPLRWLIVLAHSSSGAVAFSGGVSLDPEGKGEIPSLTPGQYALTLQAEGYARRSFTVQIPSGPLAVTLTPGGRVEIRTDAAVNARMVDSAGALYLAVSRRDGIFSVGPPASVFDHIAPGSYRLIVTGPQGEKSYPFAVAEGQTTTVQIR